MRRYLVYRAGRSDKFYQVEQEGMRVQVYYGRVGQLGRGEAHAYPNEAAAQTAANELVREKLGKGYREAEEELAPLPATRQEAQAGPVLTLKPRKTLPAWPTFAAVQARIRPGDLGGMGLGRYAVYFDGSSGYWDLHVGLPAKLKPVQGVPRMRTMHYQFSPDGRRMLYVNADNQAAQLYEIDCATAQGRLVYQQRDPASAASYAGELVALGDKTGLAFLAWDRGVLHELVRVPDKAATRELFMLLDGAVVARTRTVGAGGCHLVLYGVRGSEPRRLLQSSFHPTSLWELRGRVYATDAADRRYEVLGLADAFEQAFAGPAAPLAPEDGAPGLDQSVALAPPPKARRRP